MRNPIRDWLNSEVWDLAAVDQKQAFRLFARFMCDHGLPVSRICVAMPILHPVFQAFAITWNADTDGVEASDIPYGTDATEAYRESPYHTIFDKGAHAVRRRLVGRDTRLDYGILSGLKARGMTDYVAMRMSFKLLPRHEGAFSAATSAPRGFSKHHLTLIDDFLPALEHCAQAFIFQMMSNTLMETYLGATPGALVMKGQIRRGDGHDIRAVIWFSDLRNSTHLAATLPRAEYLNLLNRYFDCVAGSILDNGGEVLRYIGDAALAIFPAERRGIETRRACEAAMTAARLARIRLAALNDERRAQGVSPIDFGIGLHVGEVTFGNIGVPRRLEFTVIGEAANRAARLQDQCKILKTPIVVSGDFAEAMGGPWTCLGAIPMPDIPEPVAIFGPTDLL